jgi:molybdopterin molybdotransferase
VKSVAEAEATIIAAFAPVGTEQVPLLAAFGRHLAAAVPARADAPSFDNSAMDGYALRSDDLAGASAEAPVLLPLWGESRAGSPPPGELPPGHTMRIFTGAPMPAGADAVEMQENVSRGPEGVRFSRPAAPHQHVRRRGADLRQGERLLDIGAPLGAAELGLLASQDVASVAVYTRPRVAIVATGDELRELGEPPRPGSIVNSNATMLAAQVLESGAEPWVLPIVPDDRARVAEAIVRALRADVVVLSGGVSVGDYDVVRDALADAGVTLDFWKVNMKPGKPLAFGRRGSTPVLGLPGNPASSFLSFELFVRPGLRVMLGDAAPFRARVPATISSGVAHRPGRAEFVRARLEPNGDGWKAVPLTQQGSGSLRSIAGAQALVELAADQDDLPAGSAVQVRLLGPLAAR